MKTRYQELTEKIEDKEKSRKNLLTKLSKVKNKLGYYPVNALQIAKKANDELVSIVQLQDQKRQLEL